MKNIAAVVLLMAAYVAHAATLTPAVETLCAELPAEHKMLRLNNDFAGKIERDSSGLVKAVVWSRFSDDSVRYFPSPKAYVETDTLRIVTPPLTRAAPGRACKDGQAHITQVTLGGWSAPQLPMLRVQSIEPTIALLPPASVEISSSFDCGGKFYEEYRVAEAAGQFLETKVIDANTMVITLLEKHNGGIWLTPTFAMSGKKIRVGYRWETVMGPACIFHKRMTFRVSGIDAQNISLKVNRPFSQAELFLGAIGLGILALLAGLTFLVKKLKK